VKITLEELGVNEVKQVHIKLGYVHDCSNLLVLNNDSDVLKVGQMVNDSRMVGLYVEHETTNKIGEPSQTDNLTSSFPHVNEPVSYVGDCDESMTINNHRDSDDHLVNVTYDCDFSAAGYAIMFDENIISDVEFGGINRYVPRVESIGSKAKDKHKGHNVFNENSDISNSNFELGMFLTDMSLFRKTVRQHAIKNGKDVVFSINEITNVQIMYAAKLYDENSI
ncbi:RNA-binding (RRM/RBD/RNP motifs) family protein, partial [Striga asiatica]